MRTHVLSVATVCVLAGIAAWVSAGGGTEPAPPKSRLAVVWTSGDPEVAHRMVLMYTHASARNGWFADHRLVVWGPSARLLAGDKDLQAKIKQMMSDGVVVEACVVCADSYGVTERLREIGIDVKPMGKPLTELIQAGWTVLTF